MATGTSELGTGGTFGRRLFVTAAPSESAAVCRGFEGVGAPEEDWQTVRLPSGDELVQSGVGKVNGALAVARCVDPARHAAVVNLGICGSLARRGGVALPIGSVVLADRSAYADEGIATPKGFQSMSRSGFAPGGWPTPAFVGDGVDGDVGVLGELAAALELAGIAAARGAIATVSMCSGTAVLAECSAIRTNGIAEAMEGAAIGHAIRRCFGDRVQFAELRVVSNTTGDRERQMWDIRGACEVLSRVVRAITARGA